MITVNNIPSLDRRTLKHFGLDATGVFYSPKTKNVLGDLQYAVEDNKLVVLSGGYGTGKTTLVRQLKARLNDRVKFIHTHNLDERRLTMGSILEAILSDLGASSIPRSMEARSRMVVRLLGTKVVRERTPVCLVLDNTPDRLHPATLNALKLLREQDFAGVSPLLSVLIIAWPDFMNRASKRPDLLQRMSFITLDEANGWFTFPDRLGYLKAVFGQALSDFARTRIAQMHHTPEDMNYYVAELMKKAMQADYNVIDEQVIQPKLKEVYEALKRAHPDKISLAAVADVAKLGRSTVSLVLEDEPDTPATRKVRSALNELLDLLSSAPVAPGEASNSSPSKPDKTVKVA